MDIVALIGNGCSISYNPALAMEPLARQILSRFAESDSTVEEVQHALPALADAEWSGDRARLLAEPTIEVLADIDGTATL